MVTSQLENGKPAMEAMGIATKMLPNSASFRSKAAAIVGMREVQLEKLKPARKKKVLRAMRWLRKEGMQTKIQAAKVRYLSRKDEMRFKVRQLIKQARKTKRFLSGKA